MEQLKTVSDSEDESSKRLIKIANIHSNFVEEILIWSLKFCAIIMFLILFCGVFKIAVGVFNMFHQFFVCSKSESTLLSAVLNGLELIFVSPLIYLLMLSIFKYINAVRIRFEPDLNKKIKYLNNALLEIMTVKILSVALFISIIILHAIDLILKNEMNANIIIYSGTLLIILIGYYFLLDILANGLRKRLLEDPFGTHVTPDN
jgi:hypothetical protein